MDGGRLHRVSLPTSFRSIAPRLVAAMLVAGCGAQPAVTPVEDPPAPEDPFEPTPVFLDLERGADVLFVVDNSGSMGEEQGRLAAGIGAMLEVFDRVGMDVRIGITTTDNGHPQCTGTTPEGGKLQLASCRAREEEFVFEASGLGPFSFFDEACGNVCPEALVDLSTRPMGTRRDPEARPRPWVERIGGETNLPFGVSLEDALRCALPQGILGCGFESQLESMWKALMLAEYEPNSGNYDFHRPGAVLAVVFVTDEADCSLDLDHASVFDPDGDRVFWSDPNLNFATSAVCWNAGVTCEGGPGTYTTCRSVNKDEAGNEGVDDDAAVLFPLSKYAGLLEDLRQGPRTITIPPQDEVVVAGLLGVPEGYVDPGDIVYRDSDDPVFQATFGIGPGCTSPTGTAIPPVRLRDLAETFPVRGRSMLHSICAEDFAPALAAIAEGIAALRGEACYPGCAEDHDPQTPGVVEPSCTLFEEIDGEGGLVRREIPPCVLTCGGEPCPPADGPDGWTFPDGADVCYRALGDRDGRTPTVLDDMSDVCRDRGLNLEFDIERASGPSLGVVSVTATCERSRYPESDCPERF